MKTLKTALLGIVLALTAFVSPMRADSEQIITLSELPAEARAFVSQHFGSKQVAIVKLDKEFFSHKYEIIFGDGTKLEFDKRGTWQDIDGKHHAIPSSVVPAKVQTYVQKHFPGTQVIQIERKSRGRYSVELSNTVDLLFDRSFRFVGYDD